MNFTLSIAPFNKVDMLSKSIETPSAEFLSFVDNWCSDMLSSFSENLSLSPNSNIRTVLNEIEVVCDVIEGCRNYPHCNHLTIPAYILTGILHEELYDPNKDLEMIKYLVTLLKECK